MKSVHDAAIFGEYDLTGSPDRKQEIMANKSFKLNGCKVERSII